MATYSIGIGSTSLLTSGGVAGTYNFVVPANSYAVLNAITIRAGAGTNTIRMFYPSPNDNIDIFSGVGALLTQYNLGNAPTIPAGATIRIISTNTNTASIWFTVFSNG